MKLQGGLVLLREIYEELPSAEKKAARYILDNPLKVIGLNITRVAQEAGTSIAGIVRLCKRIGKEGFKELKLSLTLDVSQDEEKKLAPGKGSGDLIEEISLYLVESHIKSLRDILKVLVPSNLKKVVAMISAARKMDIYGTGASGIVAMDFYQKLLRIGYPCYHISDSHLQIISACGLTEKDIAFAISYSGETRNLLKTVREAKKSGAQIIGLTRFGKSSLAELSDVVLFVPSNEPLVREAAMSSRVTQLVMIDIIFSLVFSNERENLMKYLVRTMKAVK